MPSTLTTGQLAVVPAAAEGPAEQARPDRSTLGNAPAALRGASCEELFEASLTVLPAESDYEVKRRRRALTHITTWLAQFPGTDWQCRWVASGLDAPDKPWPHITRHAARGLYYRGTAILVCLQVVQPDYPFLFGSKFFGLFENVRLALDPAGHERLRETLVQLRVSERIVMEARSAAARITVQTGLPVAEITVKELTEFYEAYARHLGPSRDEPGGHEALWQALHRQGQIDGAPTLKAQRYRGQLTIDELVDRYHLKCKPVRDLIVDYLTERSVNLDYTSLGHLSFWLAKLFWADLEEHHPGICSLALSPLVASDWKKRARQRTTRGGQLVERENSHAVLNTVRAFYLDLNNWAHENPERWAVWATHCPVSKSDIGSKHKHRNRVIAKMNARSRTLAEYVPALAATAADRLRRAEAVLKASIDQPPGTCFTVDGRAYEVIEHGTGTRRRRHVRALDGGEPYPPASEELVAFWAWAGIEVMRLSGLRIEEMLELTHLSIRRYTQPDGQVVPLLQVAPSKVDVERVFPISPELAHVLARIVQRLRAGHETVPACARYDTLERRWGAPLPHLFQRPFGGGHGVFSPAWIRKAITQTAEAAGLTDVDGTPIRFTPHDFRRLFATEVVNAGLPIHIAAAILGHKHMDTTRGYAAVYPQEVIRAFQTYIVNRRRTRPTAEYREPTTEEWTEFEQHFTMRDVAYGRCERPYGSNCIHEHACVRCPMLRPQPSRLPILRDVERNLVDRVAEAEGHRWLGEVKGLQETLIALREKVTRVERLVGAGIGDTPTDLG